jgi:hypothetical protein
MNQTYLDTARLLVIAHLEQLPGIRWKLRNLAQLQQKNPRKFAEQIEILVQKLP